MVIFQGVLGGLRVVLVKLDLAIVHGCVAQAFFCLAALVALVTSRWWDEAPDLSQVEGARRPGRWLVRLAVVAVAVVYCQLIVGAVMRHYQAGLAIPDFPLAYGKRAAADERPPVAARCATGPTGRRSVRSLSTTVDEPLPPLPAGRFTLRQVWLAFAHRVGAVLVSLTLLVLVYKVLRLNRGRPACSARHCCWSGCC